MGKYDFLRTKNIVPIRKQLELEYEENYGGEVKKVTFNVYPYTTGEKLELQQLNDEARRFLDSDVEETQKKGIELSKDVQYKSIFYILRKEDPELTVEDVKKLPVAWVKPLMYKALEFEGITEDQLDKEAKKEIDKLQK